MTTSLSLSSQCFRYVLTSNILNPPAAQAIYVTPQTSSSDHIPGLLPPGPSLNATLKKFNITQVKFNDSYPQKAYRFLSTVAHVVLWAAIAGLVAPAGFFYHWLTSLYYSRKARWNTDHAEIMKCEQLSDQHWNHIQGEFLKVFVCYGAIISTWMTKQSYSHLWQGSNKESDTVLVYGPLVALFCIAGLLFLPTGAGSKSEILFGEDQIKGNYHLGLLSQFLRDEFGIMQKNGDYLPFDPIDDQNEGTTQSVEDVKNDFQQRIIANRRKHRSSLPANDFALSTERASPKPTTLLTRFKIRCADEFLRLRGDLLAQKVNEKCENFNRYENFSDIASLVQDLRKLPSDEKLTKTIQELCHLERIIFKIDTIFKRCAFAQSSKYFFNSTFYSAKDQAYASISRDSSLRNFDNPYFFASLKLQIEDESTPIQQELQEAGITADRANWPSEPFKNVCLRILKDEDLFLDSTKTLDQIYRRLLLGVHPDKLPTDLRPIGEKLTRHITTQYAALKAKG